MTDAPGYDLSIVRRNREAREPERPLSTYFPDGLTPDPSEREMYEDGTLRMFRGTTYDPAAADFVEETLDDGYLDRACSELYFTVDADIAHRFAAGKANPSDSAWTPASVPVVLDFQVPLDHAAIVSVPESAPDAVLERNMTDEKEYIGHHQIPAAWLRDITALGDTPLDRADITAAPFDPHMPAEKRPLTYERQR